MRQRTSDLSRRTRLRRNWAAVGEVALVSLVVGIAVAAFHPPTLTSTAAVVLPPNPQSAQAAVSRGAVDAYTATQEVIAASDPVLVAALPAARPAMSLGALRSDVRISSPASDVITVTATSTVAADAEATANAVASSYTNYVDSGDSPAGPAHAVLLDWATSATGRSFSGWLLIVGGLSALYGAGVGALGVLVFGWAERRSRTSLSRA
jgi:capsular polysaccharide biosynthesis protein